MYFSNLVSMSNYIKRTHCSFADGFISDTLDVLGKLNDFLSKEKAAHSLIFNAMTDSCHGELNTEIEIGRLESGIWFLNEKVIEE